MNYFEFFDIPVQFLLDAGDLKKRFYKTSKRYHPDFYTLENAAKQAEILELSSLNNKAYKVLSDFDARMKYILEMEGSLAEEGKNNIPQDFLMEMMDINEAIMELEFDFNPDTLAKLQAQTTDLQDSLKATALKSLKNYDSGVEKQQSLENIKDYFLKNRYLLRIYKNLNKFAPQ